MGIVHNAVYCGDGRKLEPESLEVTYELLRDRHGMGWIGLYRPSRREIDSIAEEFSLHPLAIEDTVSAHQRPKMERYGGVLFTVLRPASYVAAEDRIELGELHVFTGPDFVVTVRHAESPDIARIRRRMEADPDLLALGPEAVLYAILDQVVDEYEPVVDGLEVSIDEIESAVFAEDGGVSRRIYALSRELAGFQRATRPLLAMLEGLTDGFEKYQVDEELRRSLRNVEDHTIRVIERVEGLRVLLQNILTVNATLVGQRQNEEIQRLTESSLRQSEEVKRISSWAAILFAPSLVPTVYGMNFQVMPELDWRLGYPFALLMMALMCALLYVVFRRKGWL
ncbi:magnesium and cobalt transport protein CorA [Nocardioides sp. 616]|uniref:magnesium and cobalt transport protein CorA n=1 Tax=Nocardioides sp. 616 TaxID=2268090 RepID=UPI000CE55DBB|nr:magnesium and cobalt transport protein CorA [Nocardioides sp. 616]